MYESLHPGDGMPVRQPEFSHRCECALVRQSAPQRNPGTGFSPALVRRDGVRLCLSRYLISRMRAVSRFSKSAVVHIAHSPAAQLCGAGGCSIKFPLQRSFSPADSRVKTADSPRQKICRGKADRRHRLRRAKCASAVRSKPFTSVRGAQGIPHTACGPAFRECFRLFLSRRPSRHRCAQPMSASRRAGR